MSEIDNAITSISINNLLIAILDTKGSITVPTEKLLNVENKDKELVIDYDETGPSFIIKLRDKEN